MMLDLPLAPTDDLAQPAFTDVESCSEWIQQLQLTNLHQVHHILREQLDEFNRYPLRGLVRLQMLELLKETVVLVQGDYAKKLVSKKLPLSDDELTIFVAIVDLWQGLVSGYQRCLQAFQAGDAQLADQAALLTQRCLRYSGLKIFEYLRCGYEFEGALWHQLHALFAFAESAAFHRQRISDPIHSPMAASTCESVYVQALLECHARPAELSRRHLHLLDRWLTQWQDALLIEKKYQYNQEDTQPLTLDLSSEKGLMPNVVVPTSSSLRFVIMSPLSKLLRVKTILLQQGQSPTQLELGNELSAAEAIDFLNKIHRYCCEVTPIRQAERQPVAKSAEACLGIESIYAHIANKPFKQPSKIVGDNNIARQQIAAFGRVLSDTNRYDLPKLGYILERWQIENESILGARILRAEGQRERIGSRQLIALKPDDASAYILGIVSWVNVTRTGQLRMGVHYLPGVAQPVSIKNVGLSTIKSDKAIAGLCLPAVPVLNAPASLIFPRDSFHSNKQVEVTHLDGSRITVKMGSSLDKGFDFERVSFAIDHVTKRLT
jgi:hypothetical protein